MVNPKKTKPSKPWDKLPKEGDVPYADFLAYLAQPLPRNLEELSKQQGKSYQMIRISSSKWKWRKRAEAWDAEGLAAADRILVAKHEQISKDQLRLLGDMRTLGAYEIRRRLRLYEKDPESCHGLTVREAAALVKEAIMIERLIVGEATERIEQMGAQPIDLSGLTGPEAEALLDLLEKCGALDGDKDPTPDPKT